MKRSTIILIAVLVFLITIGVLSIIYRWVGFGCFFLGLIFVEWALLLRAKNETLKESNKMMLEQIASFGKQVGENAIQIKFLTELITNYTNTPEKENKDDEPKEDKAGE